MTATDVTHQYQGQRYKIRSDPQDVSSVEGVRYKTADTSADPSKASEMIICEFAGLMGWGRLKPEILTRFLGLAPPPTVDELRKVHSAIMAQQRNGGIYVRSKASYAIKCLQNDRLAARCGNLPRAAAIPIRHPFKRFSPEERADQLEFLDQLEDSLVGTPWSGSVTTGVVERLWQCHARSVDQVLSALGLGSASTDSLRSCQSWDDAYDMLTENGASGGLRK